LYLVLYGAGALWIQDSEISEFSHTQYGEPFIETDDCELEDKIFLLSINPIQVKFKQMFSVKLLNIT